MGCFQFLKCSAINFKNHVLWIHRRICHLADELKKVTRAFLSAYLATVTNFLIGGEKKLWLEKWEWVSSGVCLTQAIWRLTSNSRSDESEWVGEDLLKTYLKIMRNYEVLKHECAKPQNQQMLLISCLLTCYYAVAENKMPDFCSKSRGNDTYDGERSTNRCSIPDTNYLHQ